MHGHLPLEEAGEPRGQLGDGTPPTRGADSSGFLGTVRRTRALPEAAPRKALQSLEERFKSREAPADSSAQGKARRQVAKPPASGGADLPCSSARYAVGFWRLLRSGKSTELEKLNI